MHHSIHFDDIRIDSSNLVSQYLTALFFNFQKCRALEFEIFSPLVCIIKTFKQLEIKYKRLGDTEFKIQASEWRQTRRIMLNQQKPNGSKSGFC